MRRVFPVLLGALAFLILTTAAEVMAQDSTTTTTPPTTVPATTTTPPVPPASTTTTVKTTTPTTTGGSTGTTVTTSRMAPLPPPAAGPYQTLVPDLLGSPIQLEATTTTLLGFAPILTGTTIPPQTELAAPIASRKTSPSGATLALATVAWLASLGGLLVYAEEQRASRWRHLAR